MKCKRGLSLLLSLTLCFGCFILHTYAADDPQYGYDETPAQSVTVRVNISNDGLPIRGNDEAHTVLAGLDVTVPYFDLDLYGLSDYYRFRTQNGRGAYVGAQLVERPTALHLFIYLLERYYMGLDAGLCGKGISNLTDYDADTAVEYANGETAYVSEGKNALSIQGDATHIFMTDFWGHDENLMYFRNHVYPLMSANYGATSDYMLLSDADSVDVAMFSDWDFYNHGAFVCFDRDTYSAAAGETVSFTALRYDTRSVSEGGAEALVPAEGLQTAVYDADWNKVDDLPMTASSGTFTPEAPGVYYLLATQPQAGDDGASCTPGVAKVTVGTRVRLSVPQTQLFEGDTFDVTVTLGSPLQNVVSFDWQLRFDDTLFTLQSAAVGECRADLRVSNLKTDADGAYYSISYVDKTSQGGTLNAGTVCTLTFRAAEGLTADRKGAFSLVGEGVYDADFNEIPVTAGEAAAMNVRRVLPEKLVVDKLPDKREYTYRSSPDFSGLVVRVLFNDGHEESINNLKEMEIKPADGTRVRNGAKNYSVTVNGLSAAFTMQARLAVWQWLIVIFLFGWIWY